MRHRHKSKQLSHQRKRDHIVLQNLAVSLILHEKIKTTVTRAKLLRGVVEKMVTSAKDQNLSARRSLYAQLSKSGAVQKLMEELSVRYKDRNGGYTRIIKCDNRKGDAAPLARIEFI